MLVAIRQNCTWEAHLQTLSAVAERIVCAVLCVGALTTAALSADGNGVTSVARRPVYHDGKVVELTFVPGRGTFKIGPWRISTEVSRDKPEDKHPNLYIVAPGSQYEQEGAEQYAHNEVISRIPTTTDPVHWDVYFALVLDPTVHEDFRSEQQLILATQDEFAPSAAMKFEELPSAAFLREYLKIDSIDGLRPYKRTNGNLPRIIIVPGRMTVRASTFDPDNPLPPAEKSDSPRVRSSVLPH